jgi:quinol monooxygenase YgiN
MRTTAIIHHRVGDYDAWKSVYDEIAPTIQVPGGVLDQAVLRDPADPRAVVVIHTFASPEAAQAFVAREDLKAVMARAGVDLDTFRLEMLQEVQSGPPGA